MMGLLRIGSFVQRRDGSILYRVYDIKSDRSAVKLQDWAHGHYLIGWFPVSCLVFVGNE